MSIIFSIFKFIFKIFWKFKKLFLLIIICISSCGYYYWSKLSQQNKAIQECQNLYNKKINNFTNLTGITDLNVDFQKPPKITKAKNIFTLTWDNSIDIAGDLDSFKCQYNFATAKALDRSNNIEQIN